jgi:glycosyltransferase involved in cell wall biosynthesis
VVRVGIRVPERTSGGGAAFYHNLRSALEESARCEEVVTFQMGGGQPETEATVSVRTPGGVLGRRMLAPRRLSDSLESNPVDVLLSAGTEVSRVRGVPGVFWPLTVAPFEEEARRRLGGTPRARLRWRALRAALRSACLSADAFVFSSHYAAGLFADRVSAVRDRPTAVIPPAPTTLPLDPVPPGCDGPAPYLLFVSHVYPYKMLVEVVQAHAAALRRGADLDLVVAGGLVHAEYALEVRSAIRSCGTEDRVHLLGPVHGPDLRKLYRDAWAFVFASVSENAGSYALWDAFAAGLPVLSSGFSSMPEACQDAARYFDPRVPNSLALEILRLHEDAAAYVALAARSLRRGRSLPTWGSIADSLLDFVEQEVVHRRQAP